MQLAKSKNQWRELRSALKELRAADLDLSRNSELDSSRVNEEGDDEVSGASGTSFERRHEATKKLRFGVCARMNE